MLRIAIQAKGRLNEQSIELLSEAGIRVAESKRKLISRAGGFPLEVLYLRDDDIPQAVAMGVADLGIVGLNEVAEKGFRVEQAMDLGFGNCRISLAVERTVAYEGLDYFRGKRVATSYPNILARYFAEKGIEADPVAHTYDVRAAVSNPDGELLPGMVCRVTVTAAEAASEIVLPVSAVRQSGDGQRFVWKVVGDSVVRTPVTVGRFVASGVTVASGVAAGDRIVTEGVQKIGAGSKVVWQ